MLRYSSARLGSMSQSTSAVLASSLSGCSKGCDVANAPNIMPATQTASAPPPLEIDTSSTPCERTPDISSANNHPGSRVRGFHHRTNNKCLLIGKISSTASTLRTHIFTTSSYSDTWSCMMPSTISNDLHERLLAKLDDYRHLSDATPDQGTTNGHDTTDSEQVLSAILRSDKILDQEHVQKAVEEYIGGKPLAYITGGSLRYVYDEISRSRLIFS